MRRWRLLCASLAVAVSLTGQNAERPRFDRDHVLQLHRARPRLFTHGQFAAIFGWGLAPNPLCGAEHVQQAPYPQKLCGVQVLVGGQPAGLMYVGPIGHPNTKADQINFQVPDDATEIGEVPIEVCVGTNCSEPLLVMFTNKDILLRPPEKAYVHMPIWIDVEIPMNPDFKYPHLCLWDFSGYRFEVRRNGQLLPEGPRPECPPRRLSFPGGNGRERLPLHLFHPIDEPGKYEVRLSGPLLTPDLTKVARIAYSDWIELTVEAYSEQARAAWLREINKKAEKPSEWQDEGDLIPSLLALPDEKALRVLLHFLPSPRREQAVVVARPLRYSSGQRFYCIAHEALAAFPNEVIRKVIPPQHLKEIRLMAQGGCW